MNRLIVLGLSFLGAACAIPTDNCTPPANIVGTWTYASHQQLSAGSVTTSGAMVVQHQSCQDFDGTIDVVQQDAAGQRTRLSGRVTGRLLDASSLEFDAQLTAVPRQHLATLKGSVMTGSWLEVSGTAGASGDFTSERQSGGTQ
jgi:hypothetical protein